MGLIGELRERRVLPWAVGYGAAAWVVAQVAEVLAEPWGIPPGWIRLLHLLLVAGLPVAVVLAWYHGARGRQGFRRSEVLVLALLLLVTGGLFSMLDFDRLSLSSDAVGVAGQADADESRDSSEFLGETPTGLPRLAVLGFSNLGVPEQGFFAHGITEELASRLSGLEGLVLISPNSARSWDPDAQSPGEFGRTLGADFVLSGTVFWDQRDDGADVRVIPTLVRVEDDSQVWSSRIERTFADTLTLQAEIAAAVSEQLRLGLSGAEQASLNEVSTANPLAYEAYLRALEVLPEGHGAEADFRAAHTLLTQATTLDPDFLLAWTALAEANLGLYWFGYDTLPTRLEAGKAAMDRALAIDPGAADARFIQADHLYRQRDYDAALTLFAELYADRPNDARVLQHLGYLWRRQGLFDSALEALERSVSLDPLNVYLAVELSWTLLFVGRLDEAMSIARRARQQAPDEEWTPLAIATICWSRGGPDALACAREQLERFPEPRSTYPARFWVYQLLFEGDPEGALLKIENFPDNALVGQALWIPKSQLRGELLMTMGRELEGRPLVEGAVVTLRQAIESNPTDFRLHLSLGRALAVLGRSEEAVSSAERGVELMPVGRDALVGPEALYALAEVCSLVGAEEQALDIMARLMSLPTFHRGAWWSRNPAFQGLWDTPRFTALLAPTDEMNPPES